MGLETKFQKLLLKTHLCQKRQLQKKLHEPDKSASAKKGQQQQLAAAAPKQQRRFKLTSDQLEQKINDVLQKIENLKGRENKNKRKLLYNQLTAMRRAQQQPQVYLKDPTKEQEKREKDQLRRLNKKLEKKKLHDEEAAKNEQAAIPFVKKHCLRCRKFGHVLEDCPEGATDQHNQQRICFNCGSNSHTLKDCRKKKNAHDVLPFATCFVCNTQGHIARDCLQNDKGIYFKGGSCDICGSVRHLKSRCPKNPANYLHQNKPAPSPAGNNTRKQFEQQQEEEEEEEPEF